jgi:hypothetical protein
MKDHEHPFFRPLWRRVLVVVACAGWAAFEYAMGSTGWATAALAFTAYAVWQFFYLYKPADPDAPVAGEQSADDKE